MPENPEPSETLLFNIFGWDLGLGGPLGIQTLSIRSHFKRAMGRNKKDPLEGVSLILPRIKADVEPLGLRRCLAQTFQHPLANGINIPQTIVIKGRIYLKP